MYFPMQLELSLDQSMIMLQFAIEMKGNCGFMKQYNLELELFVGVLCKFK